MHCVSQSFGTVNENDVLSLFSNSVCNLFNIDDIIMQNEIEREICSLFFVLFQFGFNINPIHLKKIYITNIFLFKKNDDKHRVCIYNFKLET